MDLFFFYIFFQLPYVAALGHKRWKSAKALSYEQAVLNMPETQVTTLGNGVRVATEDSGIITSTVSVLVLITSMQL